MDAVGMTVETEKLRDLVENIYTNKVENIYTNKYLTDFLYSVTYLISFT